MAKNETLKPPSTQWEKQLFSCEAHGHRVTGIDCDTYFKTGRGCPPGPCALRDRMRDRCAALAKTAAVKDAADASTEIPDSQIQTTGNPSKKTKHCRACGIDLPVNDFSRHARTKDGYANICKICHGSKISAASKKKTSPTQDSQVQAKKPAPVKVPATPGRLVTTPDTLAGPTRASISLDFTDHPDLLAELEASARVDFRDPANQVLAILNRTFKGGARHAA
jgi:hypothetical protein